MKLTAEQIANLDTKQEADFHILQYAREYVQRITKDKKPKSKRQIERAVNKKIEKKFGLKLNLKL